ncbi:MAG TPA: ATPase, T2SS/T4P/T4SS family [Ramlibacter sp.]|jgi:pilus assembly protein CpaF|nr:ATPase, T2SS/T4P/T4SS family [Ramlibacter sp.]
MQALVPPVSVSPQRVGFKQQVLQQIQDTLHVLRPFFDDEQVNEIMVNAPNEVFISRAGQELRIPVRLAAGEISAAITLVATMLSKEVGDRSGHRILSGRLPGFRIEAILPPVAVNGPSMCIRRHASQLFTLDQCIASGVVSQRHALLVEQAVAAHETFLIVGGTGSGKTTLMNAVLARMDARERLFIIESVQELQVLADNQVLIECDEEQGVTARRAVRTAMRYAPRRIIVGELRGAEAYDWLDAANTGHPGSAATIHANGASAALSRLENLLLMADMGVPFEALRLRIADTVRWMFYIERSGNTRRLSEVSRLHGYDRARGEYQIERL